MEVTRQLARYVANASIDDMPEAVRAEGIRSLLNWVGCAVGGSAHPTVDYALAALAPFSGADQASLFGRTERLDVLNAALVNGIAGHVLDFDDTHLRTIIHPAGPIAAALFALAEYRPVNGKTFLEAFILGVEVECRIGNAVYPAHYDIGWHITGTAGVFGAAAAAGKVLGLSEQQMLWALGIAGTQSSGFREMFGTMTKSFHPGRAAQGGLVAAFLAEKNFTSSDRVLEAPRGFAHVMSAQRNFSEITEGLGKTFEISLNTYKPFACGIVIHPAIDGAVQLRDVHGVKPEDVEKIELKVAPLVLELTGKRAPKTGLEGKFSVFHSVAAALISGRAGEQQYSDALVVDPTVTDLRDRIDASVDRSIRDDEAILTAHLKSGKTVEVHVVHAIGSLEKPMSDQNLEEKFLSLAEGIIPDAQSRSLLSVLWAFENTEDAGSLVLQSCPSAVSKAGARVQMIG